MAAHPPLSRRLILLGALGSAAGCTREQAAAPGPSPRGDSAASSAGVQDSTPALPTPTRWQPDPRDLEPAAKRAAVAEVQRRVNSPTRRVEVAFAQYGGLLDGSASVLVVTRDWRLTAQGLARGGRTYDVRVRREAGRWRVQSLRGSRSAHAGPGLGPGSVSEAAIAVLAEQRIGLPPGARADVQAGRVHDIVLAGLLGLAERWRFDVSVLATGHPFFVFGTNRPSQHPRGFAVDLWRLDGDPVIAATTSRRQIARFMEAAAAGDSQWRGATNVGGPVPLSGATYFSDDTHRDHIHLGFPEVA